MMNVQLWYYENILVEKMFGFEWGEVVLQRLKYQLCSTLCWKQEEARRSDQTVQVGCLEKTKVRVETAIDVRKWLRTR